MVNGVNNNMAMMGMHQVNQGMGNGQGPKGQGLGKLMQSLPDDFRTDLQQTLKSMDETKRKDIVSQLKELDVNNLSQDELINQIQNILNPSASTYSFSVYA